MTERTAPLSAAQPEGAPASRRTLNITLATIVTMQLMSVLDGTVVNIALPQLRKSLHLSATGASWVITSYALAFGGLLLLGGRAGDVLGRRKLFVIGALLFSLASLGGGLATTAGLLIAARAVQGVGAAIAAPSSLSLIATNFAQGDERNRALGVFSTVAGFGLTLGLVLGGLLATVSWRLVMFVNVPFGVAVWYFGGRYIVEPERHSSRLDLTGALVSTVGMTGLVYALVRASTDGWRDHVTMTTLIGSVVLLVLFVVIEIRVRQPIVPLRLLASRSRAGAYLSMLLLPATMSGMFFFLSQFVQLVHGYSPLRAGLAFLPLAAAQFFAARSAATLVTRFGAKAVTLTGTVLTVAASGWLSQLHSAGTYLEALLGPMVLFGAGVGLCFMPLNMIIMTGMSPNDAGSGSGLLQTMQRIGGSLGVAILVTIYGTVMKHTHPAPGLGATAQAAYVLTRGIAAAFAGASAFAALALLVTFAAVSRRPAKIAEPR